MKTSKIRTYTRAGLDQIGPTPRIAEKHREVCFPEYWRRKQRNKNLSQEDKARIKAFQEEHGINRFGLSLEEHRFRRALKSLSRASAYSRKKTITLPPLKFLQGNIET